MNWVSANRHWLLFAATVLSGLGTAGLAAVGVLATVSTLVTGGSLVLTVGGFLLGTLLLGGLTFVFATALLSTLASRASLPSVPRSQRVANALAGLEAAVPPLSRLGLSDRVEPPVEQRRAALTERYVAGDISETELEAKLQTLLDEEIDDEERPPAAPLAFDERATRESEPDPEVERDA